jgi:FtsP/CotA-like multicopper oxidase with cupredoxin domain
LAGRRNGSFAYLGSMMDSMRGMKGNTVLVNGVVNPVLKAKKSLFEIFTFVCKREIKYQYLILASLTLVA